ncbi:MAG: hypothetical protein M3071_03720 [Actinomycetota bacterium]|nr:hypothetical protein [Actinomycetota bacterium]
MSKLVERVLPRGALLALSLLATALASPALAAARHLPPLPPEEAPPSTSGLVLAAVFLAVMLLGVGAGFRITGRRRARARAIAHADDPVARDALLVGAGVFSELDPAWAAGDEARLSRLIGPELLDRWRSRIRSAAGDSLAVDGPVRFEYAGPSVPGLDGEQRVLIRIQGRLRASSSGHALSGPQRMVLIGIAAVVLTASFVGIALAPATKIRSAGPTTILVRAGVPVGGVYQLTYRRGAMIDITVRSDRADEVHFHGYDLHRELVAGGAAYLRLRATIEGSFPIELEKAGGTLAQVVVEP